MFAPFPIDELQLPAGAVVRWYAVNGQRIGVFVDAHGAGLVVGLSPSQKARIAAVRARAIHAALAARVEV